jgi:hypothetical protein
MKVTFAPRSFKGGQIGELEEMPGLSAGAWQMRPLSGGASPAKGWNFVARRTVSTALITAPNSEFPILECAETHVRCW